jgi:hypothetical protein
MKRPSHARWLIPVLMLCAGAWWWWRDRSAVQPTNVVAAVDPTPTGMSAPASANAEQQAADVVTREAPAAEPTPTAMAPHMRVCVVDAEAQPLVGATVETFADTTPGRVATGPDGWCTLPVLAEGQAVRLLVRAGMMHKQGYWLRWPELTVRLSWRGPLRGRVLDDRTGLPVAGVALKMPHNDCKHCEPDRTTSDREGRYEFAQALRDATVVADAAGFPHQYFSFQLPGRGEVVEHDLRLLSGDAVAGRCIDLVSQQPLMDARLVVGGEEVARTGARGAFEVLLLPGRGGRASLQFAAADHCRVTYDLTLPQLDRGVAYPLPRAAATSGTVRDPDGAPIGNANVSANRDYRTAPNEPDVPGIPVGARIEEEEDYALMATTDAAGRFRLSGMIPGVPYLLSARHDDFHSSRENGRGSTRVIASPESRTPVDFVLRPYGPTGTIVGRFTRNGEPNAGGIRWECGSERGGADIERNGSFRLEHVPAGTVTLTALSELCKTEDPAISARLQMRREVQVEAGRELRVELAQQIELSSITGRVTFTDGAPAAGQTVWTNDSIRIYATTDSDGRYELRLPALLPAINVYGGGERPMIEARPGAVNIDFVVPRKGTLRYRGVDADGKTFAALLCGDAKAGSPGSRSRGTRLPIRTGTCGASSISAGTPCWRRRRAMVSQDR